MAPKSKKVEVVLSDPKPKKAVTRFDSDDDDAALGNAYVSNAALKQLGDPDEIKITIEAA